MEREADFAPAEVCVNVTVTVCAAPALTVKEVGLTVNCAASAPDTAMPDTVNVAVPMLETMKVCVLEDPVLLPPKESEVEDRAMVGPKERNGDQEG